MFHRPAETIWTKKNQDVRARIFRRRFETKPRQKAPPIPNNASSAVAPFPFFFSLRKVLLNTKNKKSILIRVLIQIRSFSLQNWQMRRFELLATRPRSCSRQNGRLFGLPDSSVIAAVNFALCVEDTTPIALLELQFRIDVDLDLWLTEGMMSNEMI